MVEEHLYFVSLPDLPDVGKCSYRIVESFEFLVYLHILSNDYSKNTEYNMPVVEAFASCILAMREAAFAR